MKKFLCTSTDSKEQSVEVKRENESFSVPQQKLPTTSSVDDSIDNTPICIGEQKQEKTILLTNHLNKEEKMEKTEEQSITNSQKANAYENEIKQKQEVKQVGETKEVTAQKVEKNRPLEILDSVVTMVKLSEKDIESSLALQQEAAGYGTTIGVKEKEIIDFLNSKKPNGRSFAEKFGINPTKSLAMTIIHSARFTGQDKAEEMIMRYLHNEVYGVETQTATQTPEATEGDSNMPWEQYCRERLSMKGENIGCDFDQSENEKIEFPVPDMYPFITKADKTYAKTINILAEGNSGKTFTMCYWTLCYIHNVPLFNDSRCPVNNKERKGTIILSFEESINRIMIKLKRCKQGMINNGIISKDNPHGCIKILTPYDSEFFELDENLQYTKLSQICEDFNIGWIFIDSAAAFSADNGVDDFNSNGKMLQVLKPVRNLQAKYGLNAILLNHPRKPIGFGGKITQQDINGASSQANISKSVIALWKDQKENHTLYYQIVKGNELVDEVQENIYKVELTDGALMPDFDQDNIPEYQKLRALHFKLIELQNATKKAQQQEDDKAEKEKQKKINRENFDKNMKKIYDKYMELGKGSQEIVRQWAIDQGLKNKDGESWSTTSLGDFKNKLSEWKNSHGLPDPKHYYKAYLKSLAKEIDTATQVDEERKKFYDSVVSDEGERDKHDSLNLKHGDKIRLLDYENLLMNWKLNEPMNAEVIRQYGNKVQFRLENGYILDGICRGQNEDRVDYHYTMLD